MRISTKRLKRRRLRIIEARKEGATYIELQKRFGVSPNYLSKLFKGKDINKYCVMCGENDPKVLEKHHPDKENRPDYWIWLCSNCHSKVTRKQARRSAKQKAQEQQLIPTRLPVPKKTTNESQVITKPPTPPFEYEKLSKAEKIAFWATVVGIPIGERIIACLHGEREKQRYERLRRDPEFQRKLQELLKAVKEPSSPEQTMTHPSQRSVAQPKPIGKAKLFHSTLRRWIEAEIWDKKYDNLTGKEKYYVKWEDNGKQSGWVEDSQLRQIFYFG